MTYFPHDLLDLTEHVDVIESSPEMETSGDAFRRSIGVIETVLAIGSAAGAGMLMAGVATPPDGDLPSGLASWVLPGLWLLATVCLPATVATIAVAQRRSWAPIAVLIAAAALAVELVVQIPFVGTNWLQAGVALLGATAAGLAVTSLRRSRTARTNRSG